VNIAHRHVLPIYPSIDILAGGAISLVWLVRRNWVRVPLALLMLWYVGDTLAVYPNFLAYFSPFVGGPSQGYQHLVDSSLDWGMSLPSLKRWLDEHNPGGREPVYLAYFGTDSPEYNGIKYTRLPSYPEWTSRSIYALAPGIYAISATLYQSAYMDTQGPWNKLAERDYQNCLRNISIYNATLNNPRERAELLEKYPTSFWVKEYVDYDKLRFARLCAWLRHNYAPDYSVDHAILIWKLSQADIDAALFGPPAELEDVPVWNQTVLDPQTSPPKNAG
jgi:hypothetical protein